MFKGMPPELPLLPPLSGLDPEEVTARARAAYLGLAVGDALGATTEFMRPSEVRAKYGLHKDMIGGGWLRLKPGQITDDTGMCLALGDSLLNMHGFQLTDAAESFLKWMASKPVDIGSTVRRGLRMYKAVGRLEAEYSDYSAGNGAAMRNLPVVIATLGSEESFIEWSYLQAHITHNNPISDGGNMLLSDMARRAILEGGSAPLNKVARLWTEEWQQFSYMNYKGESEGYIVDTVRSVLHFFFNTYDFESCMLGVVNNGGDSDTIGALAGMIAGAFYGEAAIPSRWLKKLDGGIREKIEWQAEELVKLSLVTSPKAV